MGNEQKVVEKRFLPEIQGLRAIAVTMVLLFHFQLLGAQGGFAGVDMFFVISGFLMTSILQNRREKPARKLLSEFYSKRFWRIVPAYWVTILLVVLFGYAFLLPADYEQLSRSSLSALGFISNVYFASLDGYFSVEAIYKPLLHTWSLGVEIQFYLIWPLLFICVRQFSDFTQFLVLLLGGITSILGALFFSSLDPELSFYGVITRIWEFAIGAALANQWFQSRLPMRSISSGPVQSIALFALIGFLFFGANTLAWPAPYALLPALATFTLIAGNLNKEPNPGIVSKLISSAPTQWLGELSYSLYLVHWPLVCALYYFWWPEPHWLVRTLALILSFALAYALYWGVEKPLRSKPKANSRISLRSIIATSTALVAILAIFIIRSDSGFLNRYPENLNSTLAGNFALSSIPDKQTLCSSLEQKCIENNNTERKVFLWGDSHAGHFAPALEQLSELSGFKFESKVGGACPPLPNATRSDGALSFNDKCLASNRLSFEQAVSTHNIKIVVLAARWAYYANTTRFGEEHGHPAFVMYQKSDTPSVANSRQVLEEQLSEAINKLVQANKKVVLIDQVPELLINGKRCFTMQKIRAQFDDVCKTPTERVAVRQASHHEIFTRLQSRFPSLQIIDPLADFCPDGQCRATIDGKLAYSDNNHILPGAAWVILNKYSHQFFDR